MDPTATAVCVACNRYIGPTGRCPYCDVDAPRPLALRILRVGSVMLAVLGVAWLYLAAMQRELPVQAIDEVGPLMNHAVVRLSGTIVRDCYVGDRDGRVDYVSFVVRDDTGSIRVKARDEVALSLAQADRLPQQGMHVDVVGSLSVRAGKRAELYLRSPRQLVVGASQK